jgi:antitoxin PrlF
MYGGGAAPPVKPSELGSFLLPMAAAKNCGNLQPDWQSIRCRWGDPSKAADPSSNPYFTLEPPSAWPTQVHGNAWIDMTMQMHYHAPYLPRAKESTMPAVLEAESTLTERYQTTVPETVRRALRLGKRDKIRFTIRPDGDVVMTRAAVPSSEDPVIGHFLHFLASDMAAHPERLAAINLGLVQRIQNLVGNVDVDLDAALTAEDE